MKISGVKYSEANGNIPTENPPVPNIAPDLQGPPPRQRSGPRVDPATLTNEQREENRARMKAARGSVREFFDARRNDIVVRVAREALRPRDQMAANQQNKLRQAVQNTHTKFVK